MASCRHWNVRKEAHRALFNLSFKNEKIRGRNAVHLNYPAKQGDDKSVKQPRRSQGLQKPKTQVRIFWQLIGKQSISLTEATATMWKKLLCSDEAQLNSTCKLLWVDKNKHCTSPWPHHLSSTTTYKCSTEYFIFIDRTLRGYVTRI